MMSNRRTLYRPAFFFEQRHPLICNMLCSSITRRSHYQCAHTHTLCLSPFLAHTHPPCIRTLHAYLVCVDRKLLSMWLVHRILAAFVVFSPTLSKSLVDVFLGFFFVLSFCTDITNGYFNWNFWHCLHLASEWQTSEWLARPGPGWLVCSEVCLNQLAAWIAHLILTGIHWNPWQFFLKTRFFLSLEKAGITNKGQRMPPASLKHDFAFVLMVQFTCFYANSLFWCFCNVKIKWLTNVVAVSQSWIHSFPVQLYVEVFEMLMCLW